MLDRSGGPELVAQNQEQYPPGSEADATPDDGGELELSQEVFEHVKALSVEDTQSELRKAKLPVTGDESELKVRLAQYLEEKKNKTK